MINLEVCASSVTSAQAAQTGGAFRVELCDNLSEGGTTPSFAQIQRARDVLQIQLNVLVRPRGGDFLYSNHEFEMMATDIRICGDLGCNGVVIGMLNANGSIDMQRCYQLVSIAKQYNMQVTFHRAFDCSRHLPTALEEVIQLGCQTLLTSGGKQYAIEGAEVIYDLIQQANTRIAIMPGGGINASNIVELIRKTQLSLFHGSFRRRYPTKMQFVNHDIGSQATEYDHWLTDIDKVKQVLALANTR